MLSSLFQYATHAARIAPAAFNLHQTYRQGQRINAIFEFPETKIVAPVTELATSAGMSALKHGYTLTRKTVSSIAGGVGVLSGHSYEQTKQKMSRAMVDPISTERFASWIGKMKKKDGDLASKAVLILNFPAKTRETIESIPEFVKKEVIEPLRADAAAKVKETVKEAVEEVAKLSVWDRIKSIVKQCIRFIANQFLRVIRRAPLKEDEGVAVVDAIADHVGNRIKTVANKKAEEVVEAASQKAADAVDQALQSQAKNVTDIIEEKESEIRQQMWASGVNLIAPMVVGTVASYATRASLVFGLYKAVEVGTKAIAPQYVGDSIELLNTVTTYAPACATTVAGLLWVRSLAVTGRSLYRSYSSDFTPGSGAVQELRDLVGGQYVDPITNAINEYLPEENSYARKFVERVAGML